MSMVKSFIVTVVICGLVVSSSFAGIGVGSPSNKMVPSPEIIQIQALSSPGDVFPQDRIAKQATIIDDQGAARLLRSQLPKRPFAQFRG